jgi:hypothetical protein
MAAKIEKFKKTRQHTRYYLADGTWVPGVTTITGILDKPALKYWANKIGLQGIKIKEYVDVLAEIGHAAHEMVEADFQNVEPDLSEYSPKQVSLAENGFLSYLKWREGKEITPMGNEVKLVSEKMRVGGTSDIICEINGEVWLIDLKTGSGIYPEMEMQASAYAEIGRENGYKINRVAILNIPRSEDEGFLEKEVEPERQIKLVKLFKVLREAYEVKRDLKM